uniref:Serine/threonine-protein phosphatase n=1 Tax=Rhizophora mucronata TaxID=61149 RepID=A0A2P2MML0_RHIMU
MPLSFFALNFFSFGGCFSPFSSVGSALVFRWFFLSGRRSASLLEVDPGNSRFFFFNLFLLCLDQTYFLVLLWDELPFDHLL